MKMPSPARQAAVGAVLAGAAGLGLGAAVAAHVTGPADTMPAARPAEIPGAPPAPTSGSTQAHPTRVAAPAPLAPPVPAPAAPAPRPAAPPRPVATPPSSVTMAEAMRIAARVAGGRVTESDEEREATGLVFEFDVDRADGTTRKVVIDSRQGRVLANRLKD